MRKITIFIVALFTLFITSCSGLQKGTISSQNFFKSQKLYSSIVKVNNDIQFTKCKITEEGKIEDCKEVTKDFAVGSGFAVDVHKRKYTRNIGTAGHVCKMSEKFKSSLQIRAMLSGFYVTDIHLKNYEVISDKGDTIKAKVKKAYNSGNMDVCLLQTNSLFPALHLSNSPPKRSHRYYSAGHPLGIKGEKLTPQVSGLYSGNKKGLDFYSIPSTGGSSGSAIMNKNGDIVGVLAMGDTAFQEISLSTEFSKVHYFFSKYM